MNRKWTYLIAALAIVPTLVLSSGCEKLRARDHLNKGVQAFRATKYSDAVEHFKQAIELDPTFPTARLYLASAYSQQWIPGAISPENEQMLQAAKEQFNLVLSKDPNNSVALAYMAQLNYNETQGIGDLDQKIKKLDEARTWYERLAKADAKSKDASYMLGVITWAKWYPTLQNARAKAGMKPDEPGPLKDKKAREELRGQYLDMVNEGINNLKRALEIDPRYDEAMAYLNLLYRERADLAATPDEYRADVAQADLWLQNSLTTRKEKLGVGGVEATGAPAK